MISITRKARSKAAFPGKIIEMLTVTYCTDPFMYTHRSKNMVTRSLKRGAEQKSITFLKYIHGLPCTSKKYVKFGSAFPFPRVSTAEQPGKINYRRFKQKSTEVKKELG
jgi:hypothetical protein